MEKSTKERVQESAYILFAKNGFNATSMNDIANHAKVNKASLYYYFNDKQKLYEEILETKIENFYKRVAEFVAAEQNTEEQLFEFIYAFGENFKTDSLVAPLMLRELISGGENITDSLRAKFKKVMGILAGILKEGEEKKLFVKTKPFVIYLMIVGTMNLYTSSKDMRSSMKQLNNIDGLDLNSEEIAREIANTIIFGIKKNVF